MKTYRNKENVEGEFPCFPLLAEPQAGTYDVSAKRHIGNYQKEEKDYRQWVLDNFTWEAVDKRLTELEKQLDAGTLRDYVTDSEANEEVRRMLPWLR